MVADKALGMTNKAIAEKYGAHRNTVSRVCKEVREAVPISALSPVGWREDMMERAKGAVNAGLDAPDDPYRRATVGVQALKGLGQFDNEAASANVAVVFQNMPPAAAALLEKFSSGELSFPDVKPVPKEDD